jgi:hypothetical protein
MAAAASAGPSERKAADGPLCFHMEFTGQRVETRRYRPGKCPEPNCANARTTSVSITLRVGRRSEAEAAFRAAMDSFFSRKREEPAVAVEPAVPSPVYGPAMSSYIVRRKRRPAPPVPADETPPPMPEFSLPPPAFSSPSTDETDASLVTAPSKSSSPLPAHYSLYLCPIERVGVSREGWSIVHRLDEQGRPRPALSPNQRYFIAVKAPIAEHPEFMQEFMWHAAPPSIVECIDMLFGSPRFFVVEAAYSAALLEPARWPVPTSAPIPTQ